MPKLFKDVNDSVNRYHRRAEQHEEKWKNDHHEAVQSLELEEAIAFGLTVYNLINRVDEIWRLSVHKKKVQYSPDVDKVINKAFRQWLAGSKKLARTIKKLEKLECEITGSAEFAIALREVEGVLTDDEKFFVGAKFAKLATAAVESHHSGETVALRSIGD